MSTTPDLATVEAVDQATEAWAEALAAARRTDGGINAAVRFACGSWENFTRAVEEFEPPRVRKQFMARYASIFDGRVAPPKPLLMRLIGRNPTAATTVVRTTRAVRFAALLDASELQERIRQLETANR